MVLSAPLHIYTVHAIMMDVRRLTDPVDAVTVTVASTDMTATEREGGGEGPCCSAALLIC